jgi:Domain of unknown function (DUF397)
MCTCIRLLRHQASNTVQGVGEEPGVEKREASRIWRRSSLCDFANGCVEVSYSDGEVHVRDSKNPMQIQMRFTVNEWAAFIGGVFRGEFDLERLIVASTSGSPNIGPSQSMIA